MFFIAFAFKGQVHLFAGRMKVVSHLSCWTSTIQCIEIFLSPDLPNKTVLGVRNTIFISLTPQYTMYIYMYNEAH